MFSLGNGLSSVEAWFSVALDIEEVLSGAGGDQLHVLVADVIFGTAGSSLLVPESVFFLPQPGSVKVQVGSWFGRTLVPLVHGFHSCPPCVLAKPGIKP